MGFLDRVRASFSEAVGGKTALRLELAQTAVAPGATIDYRLVLVTSGPLKAERILVGLYGRERVRVWLGAPGGGSPAAGAAPDAAALEPRTARETTTFQQVDTVAAGELALPAGQTREYTGQITVPAGAQPSYRGVDAQHTWWVRAVIEIPLGTDVVEEVEITVR